MQIFKSKPYTNGVRQYINIKKNLLSKTNNLLKKDLFGFKRFKGRSSLTGRITVRHIGGGCKKKFREITFSNKESLSIVVATMYDPIRSSFISLNFDLNEKKFFHNIATNGIGPGIIQKSGSEDIELKLGNRTMLKNVPTGSIMHSLSLDNHTKIARSAGLFFQIIQKTSNTCKVRLPSGLIKEVSNKSFGTLGSVSNSQHNLISISKAGRNRWLGIRPSVRGIAMNPVDHPHGGRTNGGMAPVTPWGIPTKGKPTVSKKKKLRIK
jgi:large subunit ribosomal protein L2